jgi:hypothetical protein
MSAVMLKLPEVHRLTRLRRPRKGLATPARSSMAHKQLAKKPAIGDGLSLRRKPSRKGRGRSQATSIHPSTLCLFTHTLAEKVRLSSSHAKVPSRCYNCESQHRPLAFCRFE